MIKKIKEWLAWRRIRKRLKGKSEEEVMILITSVCIEMMINEEAELIKKQVIEDIKDK